MKKSSFCLVLFAALLIVLLGCTGQMSNPVETTLPEKSEPNALTKATVTHSEEKIQLPSFAAFIDCANGGLGELAVVNNAELHVVQTTVENEGGGVHISGHFQPIGNWDAIGEVTGDVYQPTGVTRFDFSMDADGLPYEETFVNNFRWIGPGTGNNLLVHNTFHITINPDGTITAFVDKVSADCK